jgi:hypothetical protein
VEKTSLEKLIDENTAMETFNNFNRYFKKSLLFDGLGKIRKYAIEASLLNDVHRKYDYLEFGVYKGLSSNFFSEYVKKLYAFDSFLGLKEDWFGTLCPKGSYSLEKQIPKLNYNIEIINGWVEDTLDPFLKKNNPKINFIHFDMDTYSSTLFVLKKIKKYLINNSIILFDELYNYPGYEEGEFKALKEVFQESEFEYKAFNLKSKQVAIKIFK